jgi:hypothetical protein
MQITTSWNRILSSLLVLLYLIMAYKAVGAEGACKTAVLVIVPLACIWYGEAMGGYIGPNWHGSITGTSPGVIVCILGWVLLILPLIIMWI